MPTPHDTTTIPYDELDPPIVNLVRALNNFPDVRTVGSCGGHADPEPYQDAEGSWHVVFDIARRASGWRTLEFLAWLINNDYSRAGHRVRLYPHAAPPFLNAHVTLGFVLEGDNEDADELAAWLDKLREQYFGK